MYGLHGPAQADDQGIYPMLTDNDIKVISINLLMPDEEAPVIWRGPVVANMVKQFWSEVIWGELDFLLVDMPPGTGDVPLTVFQSLPLDGVVIVSSPQDLVRMIVKKAYNMAMSYAHSSTWSGRKLQLSEMSGLRKRDQSLWRKPH